MQMNVQTNMQKLHTPEKVYLSLYSFLGCFFMLVPKLEI